MARKTQQCYNILTKKDFSEGENDMCDVMDELCAKREKRAAIKTAKKLLSFKKISIEEIAECTNLPIEEVRKLAVAQ